MGGEVTVDYGETIEFDTDGGVMLLLSADTVISPKMSLGGFIFFARDSADSAGGSGDFNITTAGATIKAWFGQEIKIRPGVALGYQFISNDSDADDTTTGLDVGAFVEVAKPMSDGYELLGEIGFVTQPAGGNDDIDLTFGPHFYILAGIGIAR